MLTAYKYVDTLSDELNFGSYWPNISTSLHEAQVGLVTREKFKCTFLCCDLRTYSSYLKAPILLIRQHVHESPPLDYIFN